MSRPRITLSHLATMIRLLAVVMTYLALVCAIRAQGTLTFIQTGGGNSLASASLPLALPGNAPAVFSFQFGFSTEEAVAPGLFADAVTAALASTNFLFLPLVTVDASGAVWAPGGGGTVPISEADIVRQAIAYPSTAPVFAFKQAWAVSMLIPQTFQGGPVTFHLDLFDNGNALRSVAWFGDVTITPVPEPGSGLLVLIGAGLLWSLRAYLKSPARSAPVPGRSNLSTSHAPEQFTPAVVPTLLRPGTGALRPRRTPRPNRIFRQALRRFAK